MLGCLSRGSRFRRIHDPGGTSHPPFATHCKGVDRPALHAFCAEEVFHERKDSQESNPPVAEPLPHCNALQWVDNLRTPGGSITMEPSRLEKKGMSRTIRNGSAATPGAPWPWRPICTACRARSTGTCDKQNSRQSATSGPTEACGGWSAPVSLWAPSSQEQSACCCQTTTQVQQADRHHRSFAIL